MPRLERRAPTPAEKSALDRLHRKLARESFALVAGELESRSMVDAALGGGVESSLAAARASAFELSDVYTAASRGAFDMLSGSATASLAALVAAGESPFAAAMGRHADVLREVRASLDGGMASVLAKCSADEELVRQSVPSLWAEFSPSECVAGRHDLLDSVSHWEPQVVVSVVPKKLDDLHEELRTSRCRSEEHNAAAAASAERLSRMQFWVQVAATVAAIGVTAFATAWSAYLARS